MNFADHVNADARLVILKELVNQIDHRLNSSLLERVLEAFGHRRSREWLETQLHALADIGAIQVTQIGSVMVAELRQPGQDHVERRRVLAGVARPSLLAD